ncbi:MAG: sulfite exporter TauE/SafE family protein [Nitrospirae bacterium]|nr:sulfite exporter TauE/SafE family protein [Nitrospirota bacterium]
MSNELIILLTAAASIGFFHTLFGPDHYIPFIAMSKSGEWSMRKTAVVTILCGIGHVMSSVLLGIIGVTFGVAVSRLEMFESFRGNIAAWALLAFGLVYFIWGVRRAYRNRPHKHLHDHGESGGHLHTHVHTDEHMHVHNSAGKKSITPWVLFTIFVFGPCEPLIPMLMYPAAKSSMAGILAVTAVFGVTTICAMLGIVLVSTYGISLLPMQRLERYTHAIAGAIISFCGIAVIFFGL